MTRTSSPLLSDASSQAGDTGPGASCAGAFSFEGAPIQAAPTGSPNLHDLANAYARVLARKAVQSKPPKSRPERPGRAARNT